MLQLKDKIRSFISTSNILRNYLDHQKNQLKYQNRKSKHNALTSTPSSPYARCFLIVSDELQQYHQVKLNTILVWQVMC